MPHILTALATVVLLVSSFAAYAQTLEEGVSRVSIVAQDGIVEWQVENRTYDVVSFGSSSGARQTLLIDQAVSLGGLVVGSTNRTNRIVQAKVLVTAYSVSESGTATPAWAIEEVAESGGIQRIGESGSVYMTTLHGREDLLDAKSYFSLKDGNWLMTANNDLAILELPNSDGAVRMAGVETILSATLRPFFMDNRNLLAFAIYASLEERIDGFAVLTKTPLLESDDLELLSAPRVTWLSDGDGLSLSGLTLRISFGPEAWLEVPLSGDRLDLVNARMSDQISLQPIED